MHFSAFKAKFRIIHTAMLFQRRISVEMWVMTSLITWILARRWRRVLMAAECVWWNMKI